MLFVPRCSTQSGGEIVAVVVVVVRFFTQDCGIRIVDNINTQYGQQIHQYKKHLKNVGPIRHCEPLHCHSPSVATVARRLRIDVHNDDDDDDNNDNDNA